MLQSSGRWGSSLITALMMEAVKTSETLVNLYQSTRHYSPEDSHLRNNVMLNCDLFIPDMTPPPQILHIVGAAKFMYRRWQKRILPRLWIRKVVTTFLQRLYKIQPVGRDWEWAITRTKGQITPSRVKFPLFLGSLALWPFITGACEHWFDLLAALLPGVDWGVATVTDSAAVGEAVSKRAIGHIHTYKHMSKFHKHVSVHAVPLLTGCRCSTSTLYTTLQQSKHVLIFGLPLLQIQTLVTFQPVFIPSRSNTRDTNGTLHWVTKRVINL
jgi:hypothetical protein